MNRQGPGKIDWTDFTWNPVTGCYQGCSYCYARRIAERFGTNLVGHKDLFSPQYWQGNPVYEAEDHHRAFPFAFAPTFYAHRLAEPTRLRTPSKIFVASMGDLFGPWVPDRWVEQVLHMVRTNVRHTFQFLTKAPERLSHFNPWPANAWVGATATDEPSMARALAYLGEVDAPVRFISAEPLLGPLFPDAGDERGKTGPINWLILGAQTGPGAVKPDLLWASEAIIVAACNGVPVWLKDNLDYPEVWKEWPRC